MRSSSARSSTAGPSNVSGSMHGGRISTVVHRGSTARTRSSVARLLTKTFVAPRSDQASALRFARTTRGDPTSIAVTSSPCT